MHPCLALFHHRDYFTPVRCIPVWLFFTTGITLPRSDASLSCSFVPQGLFRPTGCIPILLICSTGIISTGRMHLYLALLFHRDYFDRPDASLTCSFVPQGLLCPGQMHLCLALLLHRDYFDRPDASLTCSFAPQGLFRPAECISIWFFCAAGIISAGRIHPITGRPSLKTSLPGHFVNFQFDDLFGIGSIKFGQQVIKTNTAIIILSV